MEKERESCWKARKMNERRTEREEEEKMKRERERENGEVGGKGGEEVLYQKPSQSPISHSRFRGR